jgi:hypothetical protein
LLSGAARRLTGRAGCAPRLLPVRSRAGGAQRRLTTAGANICLRARDPCGVLALDRCCSARPVRQRCIHPGRLKTMPYGAIYIAHNPRDGDNTFKVGKTERVVEERMKELTSSTSNLGTYTARAYFVVYDIDAAEQACHRALQRYRVQDNREFFELPLPRLIPIVSEQVQPDAARSFAPEQEGDDQPTKELSATALLNSAREHRGEVDRLWNQALASAIETVNRWSSLIRHKALQISQELRGEVTLKWDIPPNAETNENPSRLVPVCSVTVVSLFSKEPLALWRSDIRGGIYGDLDLSRAIGEPEKQEAGIGEKSEFVRWKERDDGRIGHIELMVHVEHAMPHDRERGIAPLPKVIVRATPIRYDDYHQNFETKYHREKSYRDPEEAFEVFLALVVENAKVPQYDVRQQSGGIHGSAYAPESARGPSCCGKR